MTSDPVGHNRRHAFPVASASPFPNSLSRAKNSGSLPATSRKKSSSLARHESFTTYDAKSKGIGINHPFHTSRNTNKNAPIRTGSLGRCDWSRHSLDKDEDNNEIIKPLHDVINSVPVTGDDVPGVADTSCEKENSPLNEQNSLKAKPKLSKQTALENVELESGCHSLPLTVHVHKDTAHNHDKTKDPTSNRREHLKNRMRSFEILPTFRKPLFDSTSHSSLDQSDDTLSDSVQTLDYEEVSTSFSRIHSANSTDSCESVDSLSKNYAKGQVSNVAQTMPCPVTTQKFNEKRKSEITYELTNLSHNMNTDKDKIKKSECKTDSDKETLTPANTKTKLLQFRRRSSEPILKSTPGDTLTDPLASCQDASPRVKGQGYTETRSRDADRSLSAGTSGYSTDENKVCKII